MTTTILVLGAVAVSMLAAALAELARRDAARFRRDAIHRADQAGRVAGERAGRAAGREAGALAGDEAGRRAGERAAGEVVGSTAEMLRASAATLDLKVGECVSPGVRATGGEPPGEEAG